MLGHVYNWPSVAIGTSTTASKFAFDNNCYLIYNSMPNIRPFVQAKNENGELELEEDFWARMNYLHCMRGMNPFGNSVKSLRLEQDGKLKVFTKNEKVFQIKFENLTLFSLDNIFGLPSNFKEETDYYLTYDWYDVKSGMVHDCDLLEDELDFVHKVRFYLSSRIDGNKNKKDLVAVSKIKKSSLNDVQYSTAMSRLKTVSMMKQAGIEKPDIQLWKRDIFPIKKSNYIVDKNIIYYGE